MLEFEESGMTFYFNKQESFLLEKSSLYQKLRPYGVKVVECVNYSPNRNVIRFIEAKSSVPRINNLIDFNKYCDDIKDKFTHSTLIMETLSNGINTIDDDIFPVGNDLLEAYEHHVHQIYILIINGYTKNDLNMLTDIFRKRLEPILKIYKAEIKILNEELAYNYKLITGYKNQRE